MNKVYLLILLLFPCSLNAQYWYHFGGSTGNDAAMDVCTDASSNVISTGYFTGNIAFGTFTLSSLGLEDIFIAKTDVAGNYLWVIKCGGISNDRALSITNDNAGNLFVTGFFGGTVQFGSFTLTAGAQQDVFILKLDPNGTVLWAANGSGTGNIIGNSISVDPSGNVAVTGQFSGNAIFGANNLNSLIDPQSGLASLDIFTLSFNSSGILRWAKQGAAKKADIGTAVACDLNGNIYVSGQFSDTITFDQIHNNNISNCIFLLCYDNSGNEIWFKKIGGGIFNSVRDLCINTSNNILLCGEATGSTVFWGTPNVTIASAYPNILFRAKYNSNGDLLWAKGDGSANNITAAGICSDQNSNIYISGNFECIFSQYSAFYGDGIFNAIGENDIVIAKYDSNGVFSWSKQYGSVANDFSHGISVDQQGELAISGSFQRRFLYPFSPSYSHFEDANSIVSGAITGVLCNNSYHGLFSVNTSKGAQDFFFGKAVDPLIPPYDFYNRSSNCDLIEACINTSFIDNTCGPDSITSCSTVEIYVATNTSSQSGNDSLSGPGPLFNYLWSNGATTKQITVTTSGKYWARITSVNGCISSSDTIVITIHPVPPIPLISDNLGINTNAVMAQPILLCDPANIIFSTIGNMNDTIRWKLNGGNSTLNDSISFSATHGGYTGIVTYTNVFNCVSSNSISVYIGDTLSPLLPVLSGTKDSVLLCGPTTMIIHVFDSLSDPGDSLTCNLLSTGFEWSSTPQLFFSPICNGGQTTAFYSDTAGFYEINCLITRASSCGGTDTFNLTKTIYIGYYPSTGFEIQIASTDSGFICGGDSITLTASGSSDYNWSGINFNQVNDSTIIALVAGSYCASANDTDIYNCPVSANDCFILNNPPTPQITIGSTEDIICPGDSVLIFTTDSGIFQWIGPLGLITNTNDSIYISQAGNYFCNVTKDDCAVISNTIDIKQYSSPYILATPTTVLCSGDSVRLNISTSAGSVIHWDLPLIGISLAQTITTAGIYSCSVLSCNILTYDSVEITSSNFDIHLTQQGPLTLCEGDSISLTTNIATAVNNWQPSGINADSIFVSQNGSFSVISYDAFGCIDTSETIFISLESKPPTPQIISNSPLCESENLHLESDSIYSYQYSWSGPGGFTSSSQQITIPSANAVQSGNYYLQLINNQCKSDSAFTTIEISRKPQHFSLLADTIVCKTKSVIINSGTQQNVSYSWNGPSGFSSSAVNAEINNFDESKTGYYTLILGNQNCFISDSIYIRSVNCDSPFPSVFTPNGDNVNDFFDPNLSDIPVREFKIFNRWGKLIYKGVRGAKWNGKNEKGIEVPEGTYYFIIELEQRENVKGVLELIR